MTELPLLNNGILWHSFQTVSFQCFFHLYHHLQIKIHGYCLRVAFSMVIVQTILTVKYYLDADNMDDLGGAFCFHKKDKSFGEQSLKLKGK